MFYFKIGPGGQNSDKGCRNWEAGVALIILTPHTCNLLQRLTIGHIRVPLPGDAPQTRIKDAPPAQPKCRHCATPAGPALPSHMLPPIAFNKAVREMKWRHLSYNMCWELEWSYKCSISGAPECLNPALPITPPHCRGPNRSTRKSGHKGNKIPFCY